MAAVRRLVDQGKTVIFITHKLKEVKKISNRVTVMRHEEVTGQVKTAEVTEEDIARMRVGLTVLFRLDKPKQMRGAAMVSVRNLSYIDETGRPKLRCGGDAVNLQRHSWKAPTRGANY